MADTTWNPGDKHANIVLSNGNLTATATNTLWKSVRATDSKSSGKWYWEVKVDVGSTYHIVGAGTSSANINNYCGSDVYGYGYAGHNGYKFHSGGSASYGSAYTTNDIIGVALDLDNGKIWWSKNGVWQASGDPANGTNEAYSGLSGSFFPMYSPYTSSNAGTARFSSSDLTYLPPIGFSPLGGFTYYFSGYVFEEGVPVSRTLYLHDRSDGSLVDTTTSSGNGYYYLETTSSGSHYIVCLDSVVIPDYSDLILGDVYPTEVV